MTTYYTLTICGLTRQLPIKAISKNTKLANFNLLGDTELVNKSSYALYKNLSPYEFDAIVGPESKIVPVIHKLAEKFNHTRYVICRKSIKPYMVSPITLKPLAHFPKHVKQLVLDGTDAEYIKGKNVAIVDDVVSTGVTMRMMNRLMKQVGATTTVIATIIKQGEKTFDELDNLIYLETLPIFKSP